MATQPIGGPGSPSLDDALRRPSSDGPDATPSTGDRTKVPGKGSAEAATGAESTEKVQISRRAHDLLRMSELMNSARNTLDETPAVRADRIAEVRERLRAGVYDTEGVKQELAHRLSGILGELPDSKASSSDED